MPPDVDPPQGTPTNPVFPSLPIVTPDAKPRSQSDRYGGLFYLGIAGLVTLLALFGWFGFGLWSTRAVWANVYVLHDEHRPEPERVQAAYAISRDPHVNQRQLWDMCLRRSLPEIARYLLAEALTADAAVDDPKAYGLAVARSEGWPDWLRLLLTRPIAYAAGRGSPAAREPLVELTGSSDPAVVLWARFALAASLDGDAESGAILQRTGETPGPYQELAQLLVRALEARYDARKTLLDEATLWMRGHHPDAARVWKGWEIRDGRVVRSADAISHANAL